MKVKERKINHKGINNFVYSNFKFGLQYIKNTGNYIWFATILFFCLALIGGLFPIFFQQQILDLIRELLQQTEGLDVWNMIRFIFINNLKSSFFALFLGIFFGIIPLAVSVVNGYVLGFVASKTIASEGVFVLWRLLPHGIFELPAVLISLGIGLRLGISLVKECILEYHPNISKFYLYLLIILSFLFLPISFLIIIYITLINKRLRLSLTNKLINSSRVFVFIIIPLLVLAGIIEGILITLIG